MNDANTIVDVAFSPSGSLQVNRKECMPYLDDDEVRQAPDKYDVIVDGVCRHRNCEPEDAMRALGHYILSLSYELHRPKV